MKERIERLCKKYVELELECDGLSRVLSYVLERDGGLVYGKDYVVRSGILDSEFGEVPTHFWIEFNGSKHGGMILDYVA